MMFSKYWCPLINNLSTLQARKMSLASCADPERVANDYLLG